MKKTIIALLTTVAVSGCVSNSSNQESLISAGYDAATVQQYCASATECRYDSLDNKLILTAFLGTSPSLGFTTMTAQKYITPMTNNDDKVIVDITLSSENPHFARELDFYVGNKKIITVEAPRMPRTQLVYSEYSKTYYNDETYTVILTDSEIEEIDNALNSDNKVTVRFRGSNGYKDLNLSHFAVTNTLGKLVESTKAFK